MAWASVHSFEPVGESRELVIDAPHELGKFLAYKGSIVVNGVSLTVNRVADLDDGGEGLPLLDQPDPAHDRGHHAQAPGAPVRGSISRST